MADVSVPERKTGWCERAPTPYAGDTLGVDGTGIESATIPLPGILTARTVSMHASTQLGSYTVGPTWTRSRANATLRP